MGMMGGEVACIMVVATVGGVGVGRWWLNVEFGGELGRGGWVGEVVKLVMVKVR